MSVSYEMADFIVFSMLCFLQKNNPTYQNIMKNLFLRFRTMSARVLLVPTITVLLESAWSLNRNIMHLGNCDELSRLFITDIVIAQMTFGKFHSSTQGSEEVRYYPSQ